MDSLTGILKKLDFGPGILVLQVGDKQHQVYGEVSESYVGEKVTIQGELKQGMGIGMATGEQPGLHATTVKLASNDA